MLRIVHRVLLGLLVFAVIGAPSLRLAQAARYSVLTTMVDMPCDAMTPMTGTGHSLPKMPCKGLTPDCIKQMGCVADVALPIRLTAAPGTFVFSPVAYWATGFKMAGLAREPEDSPPRTT